LAKLKVMTTWNVHCAVEVFSLFYFIFQYYELGLGPSLERAWAGS